ncbi:MATE family efflux transporter [Aliarcobacter butzleri]|uniref:hypothetical protein n=1 Tax=Aliarcobacter butzleri TaxID=28197 RepID=UPI0021B3104A|nr:hypothetical protein [Aliarcobacter butzleri]MCT7568957.1 hypothetical protein [Aliarcobacter butzleri]
MKDIYYTILTQVVQMGGGLLVFKILTSKLSSLDFGIYALILSFSAIIFTFPFTAIQQALIKYTSVLSQKRAIDIYKTIFILDIVFFAIYIFLTIILFSINLININSVGYVVVMAYIFSEVLKINNYMFLNSLRNRKKYFYSIFIEFFLKILLLSALSNSTKEVFIIFVIVNTLAIIYSKPNNLDLNLPNKIQFFYWSKMIYVFATPLAIWGIFGWMRDMSNRWIIEYYLTLNDVALFAVINSLIVILPGALQAFLGMFFMPILYKKEKKQRGSIRKFNKNVIIIGFLIIFFGTIFIELTSEYIIILLSDIKYINGAWMLAPMFFAFSLFSLSMSTTAEIFAHNKTKLLLIPNIISGIISIVSFTLFIKLYAINGALYAFMLSYISYSIITFIVVYRFKYDTK